MQTLLDFAGQIQVVAGISIGLPLILHYLRCRYWSSMFQSPPLGNQLPLLDIILPMWNEELVAHGKLEDIVSQDYPTGKVRITFVDSCSTDSTVEVVSLWEEENIDRLDFPISHILMERRLGKSAAINLALDSLSEDAEVIVMSDADARLEQGSLLRIGRWMSDPSIGAVSGTQKIVNREGSSQIGREESYRGVFNTFRFGESARDSTPIFEGSLAAYRVSALNGSRVRENANADDSQLALAVRFNGHRAIMDPELKFNEFTPSNLTMSRRQKVRRAQGLVRMFARNFKYLGRRGASGFRSILAFETYFHLVIPWLTLVGLAALLTHLVGYSSGVLNGLPIIFSFNSVLAVVSVYFVACVALGRFLPLSEVIQSFIQAEAALLEAQLLIIFGQSLHKWEQVTEVREFLHDLESD